MTLNDGVELAKWALWGAFLVLMISAFVMTHKRQQIRRKAMTEHYFQPDDLPPVSVNSHAGIEKTDGSPPP